MGLFSVLGSLAGGLFAKSAAKKARKNSIEDTLQSLPRLRESAEAAGFNPLTALLATGGSGFNNIASGVAPLASTSIIQNAVEGFGDIVTGRDAEERSRQKVVDDLNKLKLEQARSGGAGNVVTTTTFASRPLPSRQTTLPSIAGVSSLGANQTEIAPFEPQAGSAGVDGSLNSRTEITYGGRSLPRTGNDSDAAIAEENYGEIGGEVVGLSNLANDVSARLRNDRSSAEKTMERIEREAHQRSMAKRRETYKKVGLPPLDGGAGYPPRPKVQYYPSGMPMTAADQRRKFQ